MYLETTKDYVKLYENMGCVPYMLKFFNKWPECGNIGRVNHWSTAYAVESKRTKWRCSKHKKWHNILDYNSKEMVDYCPNMEDDEKNIHPRYYKNDTVWKDRILLHPNKRNIWDDIEKSRLFHFYSYLWNDLAFTKGIETNESDYITGLIPVIDIDTKGKSKDGRVDMMSKKTFNDLQGANSYIVDILENNGIKFYKQTSGNGLYFILKPYKMNTSEIACFNTSFLDFCYEIITYLSDLKHVSIDNKKVPGWNSYYKCPFSLHKFFDRIALPLPSHDELDYEYIEKYQNPVNINVNNIKKIWSFANYDK